jgi:hypothetical protein
MKSFIGLFNSSNLHAIISISLIFALSQKIYFAVLEEIYDNVGQQF